MKYLKGYRIFESTDIRYEQVEVMKDICRDLEDNGFGISTAMYGSPKICLTIKKENSDGSDDLFFINQISKEVDHLISYINQENYSSYSVILNDPEGRNIGWNSKYHHRYYNTIDKYFKEHSNKLFRTFKIEVS